MEYDPAGDGGTGRPTTVINGVTMTDYVSIISEAVQTWHANFIRFPFNQDYWFGCTTNGHTPNQVAYQGMLQAVVNYCNQNNVYIALDLHWSGQYTGTVPTAPCGGTGWGTSNAQQNMPDWNAVTLWSSVAGTSWVKNNPAVLLDLYNEPHDVTWAVWQNGGATGATPSQSPGLQGLLNAVRGAGANNVVIAGGLQWAYDLTGLSTNALTDSSGNGVIYAAHVYPNKGTAGSATWDPYVTVATSSHAVIVSEFGQGTNDGGSWDNTLLGWLNGSNGNNYVYSGSAWCFSSDVGPTLLTSFSGYPTTSWHGAPVSTWLYNLNQTPTPTCGSGGATNTPTFTFTSTSTRTFTPTNTATGTFTFTNTYTRTNTPTNTNTATNSFTNTSTPTRTNTPTSTNTGTNTNTNTNTPTRTNTPTSTFSNTLTVTSTNTATATGTNTFTNSPTRTNTPTNTNTGTPTSSFTPTMTYTPTVTPTNTVTSTLTRTFTPTFTNTSSFTFTNTASATNTSTSTRTNTPTATSTNSPTNTGTPTNTNTGTQSPTSTFTNTGTSTNTSTATSTNTVTTTGTSTFTSTFTSTRTFTMTSTNTNTATNTPINTSTFTNTNSPTRTFTPSFTNTNSLTSTSTNTATFTNTPTRTNSFTSTATPTLTPTNTATSTGTQSPTATFTNTGTSTNTGTPTFTSTSTPTRTFTMTSTPSFTNTNSPTRTFTPTLTSTATWTPTAVTVVAGIGPNPPTNSTQSPGVTTPIAQFQLTNPGNNPATITAITLTGSGTGNFTTGINSANLFLDVNGNGVVDAGDTLLGMGNFSSSTAVINLNTAIPGGSTVTFLVVYQFSNTVPLGTYTTQLTGATGSNATGSLQFTGLPINAATITVASATNTPSATFTSSFTPTVSSTATFTATATSTFTITSTNTPTSSPTPGLGGGVTIGPPYPNPADGPVKIPIQALGIAEVHWSVFTSGFRKIDSGVTTINGIGFVQWDLKDKMGTSVADGIYYIRIDVSGTQNFSKIWKVLVLR